jgi:phosphoserine phosphatase
MRSPGATVLRLVAFDMDGTLVDVASSWRVVHDHFGDHNDEGLRRFLANEIDDEEFIRSDVRVWWRHAPHLTIGDLEEILARVPLMPGAEELLRHLHLRRVRTAIVSGGLDLLARRIGRELGIEVVLANGLRTTSDGRLTGEGIVRVPIHGKEGVLARLQAQLGIAQAETASVGNSEIDVGLFRRSRLGVAFLPEDDAVRSAAGAVISERDLGKVVEVLDRFPAA